MIFDKKFSSLALKFNRILRWQSSSLAGKIIRLAVSLLLISYLIFKINWSEVLRVFTGLNFWLILLALAINFLVEFFSIKRHHLILRQMGEKIGLWQLSKLYFFGLFASLFLPAGGDISKFVMLKTKGNVGLKTSATSLIFDRLIGLIGLMALTSASIIVSGLWLSTFRIGWLLWPSIIFLILLILALIAIGKWKKQLFSLISKCLFFSLLYLIIIVIMVFLIGRAINPATRIVGYFIAVPVISFGSMLPISIGGLGIREWLLIYFAGFLGLTREAALSISLIMWLFLFVEGVVGAIIYYLERKNENIK